MLTGKGILWLTCQWIVGLAQDHAANFVFRVDLVRQLDRLCGCHQLVVQCVEAVIDLCRCARAEIHQRLTILGQDTTGKTQPACQTIDFVKGQPPMDFALVLRKQSTAKIQVEVNQTSVTPAAVVFTQVIWHFQMGNCDQWFDTVFFTFIKYAMVERNTLGVRRSFIAMGEQPRPVDGQAEHRKAHLGKEGNILFVPMVEIYSLMAGVKYIGPQFLVENARVLARTGSQVVNKTGSFAILVPGTLALVGACRAAPEKTLRESGFHRATLLTFRFDQASSSGSRRSRSQRRI